MLSSFLLTTALGALGMVVAWTVLATALVRRLGLRVSSALAVAVIVIGLLGYGTIGLAYFSATAALVVALGSWVGVAIAAIFGLLRKIRPPRELILLAPVALVIAGVSAAYATVNTAGLTPFERGMRVVFGTSLPGDTYIPADFAKFIMAGASTHAFHGDWNGGDRPPLQSGIVILFGVLRDGWSPALGTTDSGYAGSFAAQLLVIPAAYALARAVGFGTRSSRTALLFAGATLTWIVNSVFTWPKLLAAGLAVAAIVVLVEALRGKLALSTAIPMAIAGWCASFLAHGSGAFALVIVAVLVLAVLHRFGWSATWRPFTAGIGLAVAMYLPWMYYQRVIDPPGDRLLKWHLAGVIPINDHSFFEDFRDAYSKQGLGGTFESKLEGLRNALVGDPFAGIGLTRLAETRTHAEWSNTYAALSLGCAVLVAFMVATLWKWLVKKVPLREQDPAVTRAFALVGLSFVAVAGWALIMFDPQGLTVHQGSHVWLVIWLVLPMAWLARAQPRLALIMVFGQLLVTLNLLAVPWWINGVGPANAHTGVLAVALIAYATVVALNQRDFHRARRKPVVHAAH